ncbi:MAG: Holliday junction resolvase RecU [Bacilli bacterium]|jgi:recombination protein U|nr:Holliday junction resolvase RecU [Bacilli bacterium]
MKYPTKIKTNNSKTINYANRGMSLENDLNITNKYYFDNNIGVIYKKPTPIKVVSVEYKNNDHEIKKAFYEKPSTTDYNGIYKGKYIDFEAKEVQSSKGFPISNIHKHQLEHIAKVIEHGAICFIIVRFKKLNKTFYLEGEKLINAINTLNSSSIPLDFFEKNGYIIKDNYNIRIDYLSIVNILYFGGNNENN